MRSAFPPSARFTFASACSARVWKSTVWFSMRWWLCATTGRRPKRGAQIDQQSLGEAVMGYALGEDGRRIQTWSGAWRKNGSHRAPRPSMRAPNIREVARPLAKGK
jgi:hypothetical protein